jgi:hypothetical protein
MREQTRISVWIAREIRRWQIAEATGTRTARSARPGAPTQPRPPIRRAVGRSIIAIGERVAAEPSFRPARTP